MQVECKVNFIRFLNPENGQAVFETKIAGRTEFVRCSLPGIRVGSTVLLDGDFQNCSRYGRTFIANTAKEIFKTEQSVFNLLSSGLIKGIGPGFATRIVSRFGMDTLNIMDNEIERLKEIPGISGKSLERIKASWQSHRECGEMLVSLQDMGIDGALALRILEKYGPRTKNVIEENPYCLANVWNVPFALTDTIALSMGITKEDPRRITGGIKYLLSCGLNEGHSYLNFDELKKQATERLGIGNDALRTTLLSMIEQGSVVNEDMAIYLPSYIKAERAVAENLLRLKCEPLHLDGGPEDLDEQMGLKLDESQKNAVRNMVVNPVSILTGGPGTGKTTIICGMLKVLKENDQRVALAAPTGRAAKRMTELTGYPAKTIHRLLGYKPGKGFTYNNQKKLTCDAVIIDECSMIDIRLMESLLSALEPGTRVVLVGDIDQLPSVGAGDVLHDLIDSGVFPVTRLNYIHRQSMESRIVTNAFAVNHGLPLKKNGGDFFFADTSNQNIPSRVLGMIKEGIPRQTGIPSSQIQVLCPTRRMTEDVNTLLQEGLNDGERIDSRLKVGDKVMQQVNDYDKQVFNGDVGEILEYNADENLVVVDYDGLRVEYGPSELDEIELAYASTIHKSQGSEYRAVIVCLSLSDRGMLQRNLLYTAITRAKELLVVVGSWQAVEICAANAEGRIRNSRLTERVKRAFHTEVA